MVTKAVLVDLFPAGGKSTEVEQLLKSAVPEVEAEPGTTAWFGVRFGRNHYGIFDVFPDEAARRAHLDGPVAGAVLDATAILEAPAEIRPLDVLASKLPAGPVAEVAKGILLTFAAKDGHTDEVEEFLRSARQIVDDEPGTLAWFAIRFGDGTYGIFDVFADSGARFAHLTGHVPRELTKHALELLGSFPDIDLLNVVESTFR